MSTDLRDEEREAMEYFASLRLAVTRIPSRAERTAEFFADGDHRGYAVEVKSREDSAQWRSAMHAGEVAQQSRPLGWAPWLEQVVRREALEQLKAVDPDHERWWIVWLANRVQAARDSMGEQLFGSLFGVRQVVYRSSGGSAPMRNCLFARPGVFERHPEIVAAVVQPAAGQFALALNDFAPDRESFQTSRLFFDMAQKEAICDAERLCRDRGFVRVTDLSIDRRSDAAVLEHLATVYGPGPAFVIDMQEHTAAIRVPRGRSVTDAGRNSECRTSQERQLPTPGARKTRIPEKHLDR